MLLLSFTLIDCKWRRPMRVVDRAVIVMVWVNMSCLVFIPARL